MVSVDTHSSILSVYTCTLNGAMQIVSLYTNTLFQVNSVLNLRVRLGIAPSQTVSKVTESAFSTTSYRKWTVL